jgi:hypothetical protein
MEPRTEPKPPILRPIAIKALRNLLNLTGRLPTLAAHVRSKHFVIRILDIDKRFNSWLHEHFWTTLFRLITLASFAYLISERIYETGATVSSLASDPKNPFAFPFTITNNSHWATIRNLQYVCKILALKGPTFDATGNDSLAAPQKELGPGQSLNIYCGLTGALKVAPPPITEATLTILLGYQSKLFGLYTINRITAPTRFTWVPYATNPQWVRGEYAFDEPVQSH